MRYCPFCNNELRSDGTHVRLMQCSYKGPGRTREEIIQDAEGYQLGDMTGPSSRNNGAGCYDSDTDFS